MCPFLRRWEGPKRGTEPGFARCGLAWSHGASHHSQPGIITELKQLFTYRAAQVAEYVKNLSAEDKSIYLKIVEEITQTKKSVKHSKVELTAAQLKIQEQEQNIIKLESSAQEFRAAKMGDAELKSYKELKAELETAQKGLKEFLASSPTKNERNTIIYQNLNANIQECSAKLAKY